jgi:hypothetical protein
MGNFAQEHLKYSLVSNQQMLLIREEAVVQFMQT